MRDANGAKEERAASGASVFRSVLILASSFALLLLFPLLMFLTRFESWTPIFLLPILVYPVLMFHILGWIGVSETARKEIVRRRMLPWSAVGLAVGVATIPLVSPEWFLAPGSWQFLALGMFAFLPTTFAPVILAHGILFFIAATSLDRTRASVLARFGVVALLCTSGAGVAYQVTLMQSPSLPPLLFVMNGLAGIGYTLVACGFRLERVDTQSAQQPPPL